MDQEPQQSTLAKEKDQRKLLTVMLISSVAVLVLLVIAFIYLQPSKETIWKDADSITQNVHIPSSWQTCTNTWYGYEIRYPREWDTWNSQDKIYELSCEEGTGHIAFILGRSFEPEMKKLEIDVYDKEEQKGTLYENVETIDELQASLERHLEIDETTKHTRILFRGEEAWFLQKDDLSQLYTIYDGKVYRITTIGQTESIIKMLLGSFRFIPISKPATGVIFPMDNWGFLFIKPEGWYLDSSSSVELVLMKNDSQDKITLTYMSGNMTVPSEAEHEEAYYYISNGEWKKAIKKTDDDNQRLVRDVKPELYVDSMPIIAGAERELTYIVPLSSTEFLKLNITGSGDTEPLKELVRTIKRM